MSKIKLLELHTPQGLAGTLHRESSYVFNYTTGNRACELALGMQIRAESYASQVLPPILEMNRPEGFLRSYLDQFLKHIGVDEMRLLLVSGANSIGRVSARLPGNHVQQAKGRPLTELLTSGRSAELFKDLLDAYAATSGVSGVQPKVLVPTADRLTTPQRELIVKAAGAGDEFLTQNEYLCMDAARRAHIDVPGFYLSADGGLFIMERFDRTTRQGAANGPMELHSLGFEDMVVVMNKRPNEKYQGSYANIAKAIRVYCPVTAADSLRALYEYIILSVMVRNGDAHLKNFGLLYESPSQDDTIRLAPLYDVVTTSVYEFLPGSGVVDNTMALKFDRDKRYPSREAMIRFGKDKCNIADPQSVFDRIAQGMEESWKENRSILSEAFAQKMSAAWTEGIRLARPDARAFVSSGDSNPVDTTPQEVEPAIVPRG